MYILNIYLYIYTGGESNRQEIEEKILRIRKYQPMNMIRKGRNPTKWKTMQNDNKAAS